MPEQEHDGVTTRPEQRHPAQLGFTAVEVSIFMVASMVVATIATAALLTLGSDTAEAGEQASERGFERAVGPMHLRGPIVATRGDVDVDGNDAIDLSGSDIQAVAELQLILTADLAGGIDLTPPYTADSTGFDPDLSTSQIGTVISVSTDNFSTSSAAWTVAFPGEDDGDNILEKGERAELTIWLLNEDVANGWYDLGAGESDPFIDDSGDALTTRDLLTIRISPDGAPDTTFVRTTPLELTESILLE